MGVRKPLPAVLMGPACGAPALPPRTELYPASLGPPAFQVIVCEDLILPGPQGSKSHVGGGRMIESSKKVGPWRKAVVRASLAVLPADWTALTGPLLADVIVTLRRPLKVPADRRGHVTTTPDLSKLLRSTEDALTDAGVWADDALVVEYRRLTKRYQGSPDPDALPFPGALIRLWPHPCQD